jgi:DNA (cytosine-5)-methyltransferase 1
MIPTCKSYFSGGGGLDLGLLQADVDVVQSLDIDKNSCETLRRNFKHKVIEGDISDMLVNKQERTDMISITYPCTKYSTIGDIHGVRTGDALFLHAFRHVALERPEAFVLENVPGMKKFKVVMECFQQIPDYYVTTFCPLSASTWLPQRRDRLIMIGTKKRHSISAPAKGNRPTIKDLMEDMPEVNIPQSVYTRLSGKYRDMPIIPDPEKDIAPTCVAHYAKDPGTRLVKDPAFKFGVRPYSVREYARLQGFPDSHTFAGTAAEQYKQIGNAVAVDMGRWVGKELMHYFN